jgi:circadian clock protein KaiC
VQLTVMLVSQLSGKSKKSGGNTDKNGKEATRLKGIDKAPSGIKGFDDITYGGLPRGRPTLVAGAAGCGKTMFAMEFIAHGAMEFNEPGVFVTFEENVNDLKRNFASLGYDLDKLINDKMMAIDHVFLDRSLIMETGEYDPTPCSYGSATPSIALEQSASRWTPSKCSFPD